MALFGGKDESVPVVEVDKLRQQGLSNEDIVKYLKKKGYSLAKIRDAITQVDIKKRAIGEKPLLPEAPAPGLPELPPLPDLPTEGPEMVPSMMAAPMPSLPAAPMPSLPQPTIQPTSMGQAMGSSNVERVEMLLEKIIEEKWAKASKRFIEMQEWRTRLQERLDLMESRTKEVERRLDDINKMLIGKMDQYDQSMSDVGTEIKALEKVMKNIVPELSSAVKDLRNMKQL